MLLIHHVCDLCSYQDDMNYGGVCLFSMSVLIIDADGAPSGRRGLREEDKLHPTTLDPEPRILSPRDTLKFSARKLERPGRALQMCRSKLS
jgi:hypothetical protein